MRNLRGSNLRYSDREQKKDINPLDGVANLSDLMLVLACGLMLALVMNWNVDLARGSENLVGLDQGAQIQELEGLANSEGGINDSAGYEEMGKVYKDPSTGKLYMVTSE
jgi:hypothetical protein